MITAKARKETAAIDVGQEENHRLGGAMADDESDDDYELDRSASHHLYSTVAESTPILLVDGGLSAYRDSDDIRRSHDNGRYEMR